MSSAKPPLVTLHLLGGMDEGRVLAARPLFESEKPLSLRLVGPISELQLQQSRGRAKAQQESDAQPGTHGRVPEEKYPDAFKKKR